MTPGVEHEVIAAELNMYRQQAGKILNLGSGNYPMPYALNVDLYCDNADVMADICKLPFEDGYAGMVEASHVLEHFGKEQAIRAVREWRRVLKLGGWIWIAVPDLYETSVHLDAITLRDKREVWEAYLSYIYGSQDTEGQFHKWAYTPQSLGELLEQEGFKVVKVFLRYPCRPTPTFSILAEAA